MNELQSKAGAALRWGWFGFLVLLAFAYLVAGLSEPKQEVPTPNTLNAGTADGAPQSTLVSSPDRDDLSASLKTIDDAWARSLETQKISAADQADWLTVSRRISLAMVGAGLSLEEIRELEQIPESQRAQAHTEKLLHDSRFHHYWAERWARFLVGTDEGQFLLYRRRRFRIWLAEVIAADWRYDRIVKSLITSEGLWTDSPQVNFLTATFDSNDGQPDPVRLAARTSRAFLGMRIDCLQCHNDFLGNVNLGDVDQPREGMQTDFHQLAAFFTSAKTGLQGVKDDQPDYMYKYLDADEEASVEPQVPYAPELLSNEGDSRDQLADWITHPKNRQAGRSAVSHMWALMFGRPAGEAVDNLPLDEPSTPVLEALTDDFIENGYDIRRLIRLIAGSKAFGVDSRADFQITNDHEDACAVFPLVRLRPEQMAGAIFQSARIKTVDRDSSFISQLQQFGSVNDFVKRYGDMGEDEFSKDSVTISQRLVMLNGNMLREMVKENPFLNASSHINMFAKDDSHAIDTVYLCALNRYPSKEEKQHFTVRLSESKKRDRALIDLFWVLLNSAEFAWNH